MSAPVLMQTRMLNRYSQLPPALIYITSSSLTAFRASKWLQQSFGAAHARMGSSASDSSAESLQSLPARETFEARNIRKMRIRHTWAVTPQAGHCWSKGYKVNVGSSGQQRGYSAPSPGDTHHVGKRCLH